MELHAMRRVKQRLTTSSYRQLAPRIHEAGETAFGISHSNSVRRDMA